MGKYPAKKPARCTCHRPSARQGEFSSSRQLSVTASKTDVLRSDKAEPISQHNSESLKRTQKLIFFSHFYRGSKCRILVNNIEIEGIVDTEADDTIIAPKSWPVICSLQEVDIQLQGVGTLSPIKQSLRCLKYIGPVGQVGRKNNLGFLGIANKP